MKASLASTLDSSGGQKEAIVSSAQKVDCSGASVTVMECTTQLYTMFVSERTAYVLTYDVTGDVNVTSSQICDSILHILNLVSTL